MAIQWNMDTKVSGWVYDDAVEEEDTTSMVKVFSPLQL